MWTDDCVVGYNLLEENKIKIDDDINLIQMVDDKRMHDDHEGKSDDDVMANIKNANIGDDVVDAESAVQKSHSTETEKNRFSLNTETLIKPSLDEVDGSALDDDGFEMDDAIEVIVGTRAIIIQIVPLFTYLSIFAVGTSHTPLFIFSDKARRFFPPMLIRDSMLRATKVEMKEANHHLSAEERGVSWVNLIRAVTIYVNDSRLPQAVLNYFWFIVTVGVIYDDPFKWILLSMIISFPFLIAGLVEVYVFVGKHLGIVDEDVYFLFVLTGRKAPVRATEDHFNEHIHKGFLEATQKNLVPSKLDDAKEEYTQVQQDDTGVTESVTNKSVNFSSFFFWDNGEQADTST